MEGHNHVEGWTADEVVSFLGSLDLEQYSDDFSQNGITGDILIHLDHEALRDIGVESVGHRLSILRAVYNIKISDNVVIEPEHYVPATAEFDSTTGATSVDMAKDLVAVTQAIQQRDERLASAENEIKRLTENLTRLKDQLSPVFKIVKELQPLPTPEINSPASLTPQSSLSRKFSTKKLFLGSAPRQSSPTHTPPAYNPYTEPESPRSPVKYFELPTSGKASAPSMSYGLPTLVESNNNGGGSINGNSSASLPSRPTAPPRPPPPGVTPLVTKREQQQPPPPSKEEFSPVVTSGGNSGGGSSGGATPIDLYKSFRVGLEDPCYKVLPAALKKYRIASDPREYSLFICYGDQERCLGAEERPLLVFQELQKAGKSPVFMLRRQQENHGGGGAGSAVAGTTNVLPVRVGETSTSSTTTTTTTDLRF